MTTATTSSTTISLQRPQRNTAIVEIRGTAPLIVHRWSEKARQMMLDAQQGRKTPKQLKDPVADFESSMYRIADGGHGFPVVGFKAATVRGGGRLFGKNVKMTELKQILTFLPDALSVDGTQVTRLVGSDPIMREDMVRVGMGTADIRYRAEYRDWSATLKIDYVPNVIDLDSVIALIDAGGSNGVGEWRPEKSGSYGTYEVVAA